VRTILIIFGIWLLINILFFVAVERPRKPRKPNGPHSSDAGHAPVIVNKNAYPFDEEEKTSLGHIIMSVAIGVFFVLVPPIVRIADVIRRVFRKTPRPK
jgi:hypothetical protein